MRHGEVAMLDGEELAATRASLGQEVEEAKKAQWVAWWGGDTGWQRDGSHWCVTKAGGGGGEEDNGTKEKKIRLEEREIYTLDFLSNA